MAIFFADNGNGIIWKVCESTFPVSQRNVSPSAILAILLHT